MLRLESEFFVHYESYKVYSEKPTVVFSSIRADFAEKFWKDISVITDKKICTVKQWIMHSEIYEEYNGWYQHSAIGTIKALWKYPKQCSEYIIYFVFYFHTPIKL